MLSFNRKNKFKRLQNTLMLAFFTLSVVPATVIAILFLKAHSQDLQEQSTSHLISMRDNKKQQIIDYLNAKESEVLGFVRSELAYSSGGRFYGIVNAFKSLGLDMEQAREYAQKRYIQGSDNQIKTSVLPHSTTYNGTERYRLLHKRYHRAFLEILKRSDFDDILLVDLEGNVTYSIYKRNYYGTNLNQGPFSTNNLGQAFSELQSRVNKKRETHHEYTPVVISDFSIRDGQMIAWMGAPIIQQGYLHSYALFRLPSEGLTHLLANKSLSSINTILVGQDHHSRTLTNGDKEIGNSLDIVNQALSGSESVEKYTNKKAQTMLAAYGPIAFRNIHWGIVVEVPEQIAFARIHQLETLFAFTMVSLFILIFIASHYLSNFITAPLLQLTWAAEKVAAGQLDTDIVNTKRNDEIGRLATSFRRMQRSIRDKLNLIKTQNQELEKNLKLIQTQNDELHLADTLKDQFLMTTSHELRTPLHGILGIAEALASGANGVISVEQKYQVDIIISSGRRLNDLVDDLLDYHKMRYGNLKIKTRAVDASSATRSVIELSAHLLGNKPVKIVNQIPKEALWVCADVQRLEQILYNLLGNAIKFTNEGKIVISALQVNDNVQFQIMDTGQGIGSDQLEHIFEPLTQGTHAPSNYRQGAGLGLSISSQLIELMNGHIYVSSQPMIGTTFCFTLPKATAEQICQSNQSRDIHFEISPPMSLKPCESTHSVDNLEAPLILVVDDEPINLRILNSYLKNEGYRVLTVNDGLSALEAVRNETPELILLDIMIPDMSGYDVCVKLRKTYDHATLPIIMLTALNQTEDRLKGFASGANDFLSKPFNQKELLARITAHLAASQAEQRKMENQKLEKEIKQRVLIEARFLETQERLLEQLETAPEAIICVRDDNKIRFANQAAMRLFKRSIEQLKRSHVEEIIVPKFLNIEQDHYCGDIEIYISDATEQVSADILKLSEGEKALHMYIFNVSGNISTSRVRNLETAIDALTSFAFEGEKNKLQELKELGGEFTHLADRADESHLSKSEIMRSVLVEAMTCSLDYWEAVTGKTKFDFAEQSGLWRVYLDRSSLQTRTLDKYLRVETLPKTPRWRTVLSSLDYILEHCHEKSPDRTHIEKLRSKLHHLLTH